MRKLEKLLIEKREQLNESGGYLYHSIKNKLCIPVCLTPRSLMHELLEDNEPFLHYNPETTETIFVYMGIQVIIADVQEPAFYVEI